MSDKGALAVQVAELAKRLDGMTISAQALEKYMDELKAKVEKLEAANYAAEVAAVEKTELADIATKALDEARAIRVRLEARIEALEAPARAPDAASEALKKAELSGQRPRPSKPAGRFENGQRERFVDAMDHAMTLRRIQGAKRQAAEDFQITTLDESRLTPDDSRMAAEKVESGRLVRPFERQAEAEYAALPFAERSGVACRAEREAMRQVGRPCPKVGCQGILAKDHEGGPAWCPQCRAAQTLDQSPAIDGADYSRPLHYRRGDFARAQGSARTVYRPPEGTRPDKVACPRAGCVGFLVKRPDAHRCDECGLTAEVVGVAG